MLSTLRSYATGWVAQLLLGILVLSFSVWGVSDIFTGFRSNDVARVGSTDITVVEFQRDYDLAVQSLTRQLGQAVTPEQARLAGVPAQVLGRLVNQATLDNAVARMGLGISNDTLGTTIAKDPNYLGSSGSFDRGYLTQLIRSQNLSENDFILARRKEYSRAQIAQAFAGGISSPTAYLRAIQEYRSEQRDLSYVVVTAPTAADIGEPSDANLTAYYDAHKKDWSAPEVRTISYFALSPEALSKVDDVADADARKRYDDNPERFTTVEKRKVEQIVFKDRAEAEQAVSALSGGKTFDALVTERNLKPADVDLGLVAKDKIIDPKIADAAFSLAAGAVSPIIDGSFGPAIVRVTSIEPAVVTTFDQAKAGLKKEIADERAVAEINDMHDSIEDARAAGGTLTEVAGKYDLKIVALPPVDANGKDADGNAVANVPGGGLVAAAFQSDIGLENDPVQPDRNSYVWYDVTAVTAPRERPLAEVHDKVVSAWKDAEREKRVVAKADGIKTRLDNKEDLVKVAADIGLEIKKAEKITRLATPTGDLSAPAVDVAFNGPKGTIATAVGALPMTRLILVVDDASVPTFVDNTPELAQTKQQLDGQFVNDLLGLYVTDLQSKTPVKFNQIALRQVLGLTDADTN